MLIKVFAKSAGVTKAARDSGFTAIAVNWSRNKHKSCAALLNIDLSSKKGEKMFFSMLEEKRSKALHIAPPCGAALLARERPLPSYLTEQGVPSSKPLRSLKHIWGLERLSGLDQAKVDSANRLYRFTARLVLWCLHLPCILLIENPLNSYFEACFTDCFRSLEESACRLYNTCSRVSLVTAFMADPGRKLPNGLALRCILVPVGRLPRRVRYTHRHLPYSVSKSLGRWRFDTASEGAYPNLLYLKVVQCIAAALGFSPVPPPGSRIADPIAQTRHSRRLLPEFQRVIACDPANLPSLPHKILGPFLGGSSRGLSGGATENLASLKTPLPNASHVMPVVSDDASQLGPAKVDVGIYATPEEYLAKACELVHPIDGELSVSDWTKRAIFEVLTTHPAAMSKRRTDFLKKAFERHAQLESDEIALHKTMVPHVRRVMKGKKLHLLKSLLVEYGYDDPGVMDELISGAPMTGTQRVPPYAERRIKPAPSTKEILEAEAKWRTQAILRRQYQGSKAKPRVIDDAKSSGLKDTYSSGERLRLQDIDYVTLMCLQAGRMSSKPLVSVALSTGEILTGKAAIQNPSWLGRTLDLRKAYKQTRVCQ